MNDIEKQLQTLRLQLEQARTLEYADEIRDEIDRLERAKKVAEETGVEPPPPVVRERRPKFGSDVVGVALRK